MSKAVKVFNQFLKDEDGAALIEYTVLLGILLIAVIATIGLVGTWVSKQWLALGKGLAPLFPPIHLVTRPRRALAVGRYETQRKRADERAGQGRRERNPQARGGLFRRRKSKSGRDIISAGKNQQEDHERRGEPRARPEEGDGQQFQITAADLLKRTRIGSSRQHQEREGEIPLHGHPRSR